MRSPRKERGSYGLLLMVSVEVSHFVKPVAKELVGVKVTLQSRFPRRGPAVPSGFVPTKTVAVGGVVDGPSRGRREGSAIRHRLGVNDCAGAGAGTERDAQRAGQIRSVRT